MNLKGVLGSINPFRFDKTKTKEKSPIQFESATERDGNGQQAFQGNQQKHEPMTDEEFQEALDHLKSLSAVKDKDLRLEVQMFDGKRFVCLKEPSGKVLRKISEFELRSLIHTKDKEKGQLLNKTA